MNAPDSVLKWTDLATQFVAAHGILEVNEILAIIWNESTGDPNAVNKNDPSWGLMGVEMAIARKFGGVTDPKKLLDPQTNILCGAGFLLYLKRKYSDTHPNWMAAYNEGEPQMLSGHKDLPYVAAFNSHISALTSPTIDA
jgi:soluble lytic murein transglycosylase-like protein